MADASEKEWTENRQSVQKKFLMESREEMYRFLGRLFREEMDGTLLSNMQKMEFPSECEEEELTKGYGLMAHFLKQYSERMLLDLEADYARVFLGAGISAGQAAFPYESVYTSPKKIIMQDARDQVMHFYFKKGVAQSEITKDFLEDHIALELEFMAYLCNQAQKTIQKRDWEGYAKNISEQAAFLKKHLLNWVPAFCQDVKKYAQTDFYKSVSIIASGYLKLDAQLMDTLIPA